MGFPMLSSGLQLENQGSMSISPSIVSVSMLSSTDKWLRHSVAKSSHTASILGAISALFCAGAAFGMYISRANDHYSGSIFDLQGLFRENKTPISFGLSQELGSCYGENADSEMIVGAVVQGYTGDWLGRVKALQIGAVISIIGTAVVAGSVNIPQLFVFRFITGLGVGQLLALVPL